MADTLRESRQNGQALTGLPVLPDETIVTALPNPSANRPPFLDPGRRGTRFP